MTPQPCQPPAPPPCEPPAPCLGDPYRLNIADRDGTVGLDLGVYGAPETYVLAADGVILHRHVGVLDQAVFEQDIGQWFPALAKLGQANSPEGSAQ